MNTAEIRMIQKLRSNDLVELLGPNGAVLACETFKSMSTWEDFRSVVPEEHRDKIIAMAEEKAQRKEREKRYKKIRRTANQTSNRCLYTDHPIVRLYKTKNNLVRFHGDLDLRSGGLAERIGRELWPGHQESIAISVMNQLEGDDAPQLSAKVYKLMNETGICLSGERLAWNTMHPVYKKLLLKCFPNAPEFAAYNHSMNSPILPHGFFRNFGVVVKKITDENGKDLGFDGSGWYHPEAPAVAEFVERYGNVPMQVRFANLKGVFMKGMLFPSDAALHEGEPSIIFDWDQVKGRWKSMAKASRNQNKTAVIRGWCGVIKTWSQPSKLKTGFQVLENIKINDKTVEIVKSLVDEAIEEMVEGGVDDFVRRAVKDDADLKLMVRLINQMKAEGLEIEPTQIPRVRKAADDLVCRMKYHLGTGAGGEFDQYVVQMDETIERGTCLVSGIRPGTEVAIFRFPVILSQGLTTLKVARPNKAHQLSQGQLGKFTVHMNPYDLGIRMQGDADGDFIGVSTDPRWVELFKHLVDDNVYHIESGHIRKIEIDMDSQDGLDYIKWDRRGPIGLTTRWRSYLLAVGDTRGARSMSMLGQQAIDMAKKVPKWFDFRKAAFDEAWTQDEDGWHFDHLLGPEDIEDGMFSVDAVIKWVGERINMHLGTIPKFRALAGWIHDDKAIRANEWKNTFAEWEGGNMVHICYNYAGHKWEEVKGLFAFDRDVVPMEDIVPALLAKRGHKVSFEALDWKTYQHGVREEAGINSFGSKFESLKSNQDKSEISEEVFTLGVRHITAELQSRLQNMATLEGGINKLLTIWWNECHYAGPKQGNLNHAFRAISWNGSPILEMMGIQMVETCKFMDKVYNVDGNEYTRLEKATKWLMSQENTQQSLAKLIYTDETHQKWSEENCEEPITLSQCPDCRKRLMNDVVSAIRRKHSRVEYKFMAKWVGTINAMIKKSI